MSDSKESDAALSDVKSVSGGSIKYIATTALSKGAGFLFTLILTRSLGAPVYGLYAFGLSVTSVARNFADLGSDKALLRFVPKYEGDTGRQGEVIFLSYFTSLVGGTGIAVVLILSGGVLNTWTVNDPRFPAILTLLAVNLVVNNLHQLLYNHFRATDLLNMKLILNDMIFPSLKLLSTASVVYIGYSILEVIGAIIGAGVIVFVMGFYILTRREQVQISRPSSMSDFKEYYNYSIPVTVGNAGGILFQRSDVIMIGFLLTGSAVGIYNVAFLLGTIIALPLSGVNQLFPPMASRLYSSDKKEQLNQLYRIITRWVFTVSLFLGTSLLVYRNEVLALFGEEFPGGSSVLAIIIAMQLTNVIAGPSGSLLIMTDHQYMKLANTWTFGICNVILNYFFIVTYGLIGAAIATFLVKTTLSIVRLIELWKLEGFFPYSYAYLKPITTASITAVVMSAILNLLGGIESVLIGGVVGAIAYSILIYTWLADEDQEILASIL